MDNARPLPDRLLIANGDQIPATWPRPREAVRTTSVAIREPRGTETFITAWGTLIGVSGEDLVIIQDDGEQYPIKKDIFSTTYERIAPDRYRKKTRARLVQVPEGVIAVLATREGEIEVRHPDYVVIGADNEVYANAARWVAEHLVFV